jgi:hypothetical protein|tara:strand:+ start:2649 stop:3038 length:390 start_codon:yes stop_codon:yes gene_type:complete
MRKAAGAGAAGAAAADAAKLLRGAHLSTQDASRERVTPSLFVRRAFEHDAYEFDAARDDDTINVVDRAAFSNTIVVVARSETTHLRAARNATTTADNDMTISLALTPRGVNATREKNGRIQMERSGTER